MGENQVLQAGDHVLISVGPGWWLRSWYKNLTFSLGLSLSLESQPLHGLGCFHLWRSDKVETAGLGLGESMCHVDCSFLGLPFSLYLRANIIMLRDWTL